MEELTHCGKPMQVVEYDKDSDAYIMKCDECQHIDWYETDDEVWK